MRYSKCDNVSAGLRPQPRVSLWLAPIVDSGRLHAATAAISPVELVRVLPHELYHVGPPCIHRYRTASISKLPVPSAVSSVMLMEPDIDGKMDG